MNRVYVKVLRTHNQINKCDTNVNDQFEFQCIQSYNLQKVNCFHSCCLFGEFIELTHYTLLCQTLLIAEKKKNVKFEDKIVVLESYFDKHKRKNVKPIYYSHCIVVIIVSMCLFCFFWKTKKKIIGIVKRYISVLSVTDVDTNESSRFVVYLLANLNFINFVNTIHLKLFILYLVIAVAAMFNILLSIKLDIWKETDTKLSNFQ